MARPTKTELQRFAKRIERQIIDAGMQGSETMERMVCRLLTDPKNPAVASALLAKWVEWRYGKPTDRVEITGQIEHAIIDPTKLTEEELSEAEKLIESAFSRSDQG